MIIEVVFFGVNHYPEQPAMARKGVDSLRAQGYLDAAGLPVLRTKTGRARVWGDISLEMLSVPYAGI